MAFAPFISFGNYMPNPTTANLTKQKAEYERKFTIDTNGVENIIPPDANIDNLKEAGITIHSRIVHANVGDFPNHYEVVTYPKTDDNALNTEPFRQWNLIKLPKELGGGTENVSSFRLFSSVCLHLWCFWGYDSALKKGFCPCHGSGYDMNTGEAKEGPASAQARPSNVLPKLDLEADRDGFLWIKEPEMAVDKNGVVGYGRLLDTETN